MTQGYDFERRILTQNFNQIGSQLPAGADDCDLSTVHELQPNKGKG
jgi:hypothetical protein